MTIWTSTWPLLITQLLSICIAGTAISSTYLAQEYNVDCPGLQSTLTYALIALIYLPLYAFKGPKPLPELIKETWWQYAILGLIDYEANYCVVMAYQHTSVTSVQMLDSSTIIFVLILSYFILKRRFTYLHLFFVLLVFIGLGLMIWSDVRSSGQIGAKWLGCVLVIVGCMMYAISNVALEKIVNSRPYANVEYLSQLSMWALIFSSIQMAILERDSIVALGSNPHGAQVAGWLICFTISLFTVYSLMPIAFELSSAVFVNLGLLTADIYALIVGIYLFDENFDFIYLASFFIILISLIGYHIESWRFDRANTNQEELLTTSPDLEGTRDEGSNLLRQSF